VLGVDGVDGVEGVVGYVTNDNNLRHLCLSSYNLYRCRCRLFQARFIEHHQEDQGDYQ
jgi:hypothetical protein